MDLSLRKRKEVPPSSLGLNMKEKEREYYEAWKKAGFFLSFWSLGLFFISLGLFMKKMRVRACVRVIVQRVFNLCLIDLFQNMCYFVQSNSFLTRVARFFSISFISLFFFF